MCSEFLIRIITYVYSRISIILKELTEKSILLEYSKTERTLSTVNRRNKETHGYSKFAMARFTSVPRYLSRGAIHKPMIYAVRKIRHSLMCGTLAPHNR